jgi:hypothetical protein
VALELTGVYWSPLFELVERRGFAVRLVDPQQVQKIKGRPKSDVHDGQWLQRLQTFGLLAGAFRSPTKCACGAAICGSGPCYGAMPASISRICTRP